LEGDVNQDEIDQAEWENPANWSGFMGLYRSERDSRPWVPKRPGQGPGMAPNMAKPGSKTFFWGLAIMPAVIVLTVILFALFGPDR
jgi:uncharacterized membrane protein